VRQVVSSTLAVLTPWVPGRSGRLDGTLQDQLVQVAVDDGPAQAECLGEIAGAVLCYRVRDVANSGVGDSSFAAASSSRPAVLRGVEAGDRNTARVLVDSQDDVPTGRGA
jgi:hypothetical protein